MRTSIEGAAFTIWKPNSAQVSDTKALIMRHCISVIAFAASLALTSVGASAHGYAGSRFFPATILIEDPFVADELALPTYTHRKGGDEPGVT
ncbi:MAG: hypothetical protein K8S25_00880, partial [Alphaproteobacteria bacterium]|nr:hypothetical protein [Alphaproteobacteria bacterium]